MTDTDKLIPVGINMLRGIQKTIWQAMDYIRGEHAEDMSEEEARQDTLSKLKEADNLLTGAEAFASLMKEHVLVPKEPTVAMFEAGYSDNDGDRITSVTEIWKAMLAAARES